MIGLVYLADGDVEAKEEGKRLLNKAAGDRGEVAKVMHRNPRFFYPEDPEKADAVVARENCADVIKAYEDMGADVFVLGQLVDPQMHFQHAVTEQTQQAMTQGEDYVDMAVVEKLSALSVKALTDILPTLHSVPFLKALFEAEGTKDRPRKTVLSAINSRIEAVS